jgi:hypothetical protein
MMRWSLNLIYICRCYVHGPFFLPSDVMLTSQVKMCPLGIALVWGSTCQGWIDQPTGWSRIGWKAWMTSNMEARDEWQRGEHGWGINPLSALGVSIGPESVSPRLGSPPQAPWMAVLGKQLKELGYSGKLGGLSSFTYPLWERWSAYEWKKPLQKPERLTPKNLTDIWSMQTH